MIGRVGVLGGGQLGRMLALAGVPLDLRVSCYAPSADVPAAAVVPVSVGEVEDAQRLSRWAAGLDVVTYELEALPVGPLEALDRVCAVRPGLRALAAAQDRWQEKELFRSLGISVAPTRLATDQAQLLAAVDALGDCVVKTRTGGYDGRGQVALRPGSDAGAAVGLLASGDVVVEGRIAFDAEVSVVGARGMDGAVAAYPLTENQHRDGILRVSRVPARVPADLERQAGDYLRRLLEHLDYVGVLALELFAVGGGLVANEMAPRVHNSAHWTIEGAETSQFEQHLRAITGLPLGSTAVREPSAMVNLVGVLPPVAEVLQIPEAHLHLYGKTPRPGRKLGHVTVTAAGEERLERRLSRVLDLVARPQAGAGTAGADGRALAGARVTASSPAALRV